MRVLRLIENKIVCDCGTQDFTIIDDWRTLKPNEEGKITWVIESTTPDMPFAQVVSSFQKSSIIWTQVFKNIGTGISVERTFNSTTANIKINFANNGHPNLPFPFEQGVLAYAMNDGVLWFNDIWDWTGEHDGIKIFLDAVFVHELGHNFRIGHSDVEGDIMAPYIDMESGDIRITPDTQNALREVYKDFIISSPIEEPENNCDKVLIYKKVILSLFQDIKDTNKKYLVEVAEHLGLDTEGKKRVIIKRIKEHLEDE